MLRKGYHFSAFYSFCLNCIIQIPFPYDDKGRTVEFLITERIPVLIVEYLILYEKVFINLIYIC